MSFSFGFFVLFLCLSAQAEVGPISDQIKELYDVLKGKRVGMLTNPTSVDESYNFLPDVYSKSAPFTLVSFFAPEHGLRGDQQAGTYVSDYVDEVTNLPVYSVYGARKAPTDEQLAAVDAVLFDIQDVGTRFYTFVWTMTYAMEACARLNKTFVVFDRPNPLGLDVVEGPPNTEDAGLIGRKWPNAPFGVPTRHGLTAGELAFLVDRAWMNPKLGDKLRIIRVPGLERNTKWTETGRPWVLPSPNMPTTDTALVYPGTGLFEDVSGASEGRGTTRPFEMIATPSAGAKAAAAVADKLNSLNLPGCRFRSTFFTPTFGPLEGKLCGGIQVHVTDPDSFKSVKTGMSIVQVFLKSFPGNVTTTGGMDKKCGLPGFSKAVLESSIDEIEKSYQTTLGKYLNLRQNYLLY